MKAARQFRSTLLSSEHHHRVKALFMDGSTVNEEFQAFKDGGPRKNLPAFRRWIQPFRMIQCNELSVEGLHRDGTMVAQRSPFATAVEVSHALRSHMVMRELRQFSLDEWAAACEGTRSEFLILNGCQLEDHIGIESWKQLALAGGKPIH